MIFPWLLWGCGVGKRPFLMVQVCVRNSQGMNQLLDELHSLAASGHMRFSDNGAEAARELPNLGYRGHEREDGSPAINAVVIRADGMGVGASNLGLPGYWVGFGFSEGVNPAEAQHFADEVVRWLGQRWHVEALSAGSPSYPKVECK
jgi:hypothetical protein